MYLFISYKLYLSKLSFHKNIIYCNNLIINKSFNPVEATLNLPHRRQTEAPTLNTLLIKLQNQYKLTHQ